LILLAISAVIGAIYRLALHQYPDTAIPGLVISFLSLTFMYFLWVSKLKAADILNSKTIQADAACSKGCISLSTTLFAGSVIMIISTELFDSNFFWWIDSIAGIVIACLIFHDGYKCVTNAMSKDFDGTCGCC